jgi:ligand-binding sensor domain-containing protein
MKDQKNCWIIILFLLFSFNIKAQNKEWINYTNGFTINTIVCEGNTVWVGTKGGLVKINRATNGTTFYNKDNSGLAGTCINAIVIDKEGNKWIATGNGVSKFDGVNWTNFDSTNSGLYENKVFSVAIDSNGAVWFGSKMGATKYDGIAWKYYKDFPYVHVITIDGKGNKWFARDGYAVKFNDTTWTYCDTINYGYSNDGYIVNYGNFYSIKIDSKSNKWFATESGLIKYNDTSWTFYNRSNSKIPGDTVMALYIDSTGNKWVGTNAGLAKFDDTNWVVYDKSNSDLLHDTVLAFAIDANGNKWIASKNGRSKTLEIPLPEGVLQKYDNSNWTAYVTTNSGLLDNCINSVAEDKNRNIWIATDAGGLEKFDGNNWTNFNRKNSPFDDNEVLSIAVNSDGNKLVMTYFGLYEYNDISWTTISYSFSNGFRTMIIDKEDNIWTGNHLAVWQFGNTERSFYTSSINSIAIDANGIKWAATSGYGLAKFDTSDVAFCEPPNSSYLDEYFYSVAVDSKGNKWVGTATNKLLKYNDTTWVAYDSTNSSALKYPVSYIIVDKSDTKWLGTFGGGLIKYDGNNWTVYNTYNSCLSDNYINSITIDRNGNKWISTAAGGVSVFNEGGIVTGVEKNKNNSTKITRYSLSQNYPNPFNPITTINYSIPKSSSVTIKVYDVLGKEVATLVNEEKQSGNYSVQFGTGSRQFASGVYLYRMISGDYTETKKFVLMK